MNEIKQLLEDISKNKTQFDETIIALELIGKIAKQEDKILTHNINIGDSFNEAVNKFKRRFILSTLVHTRGNQTHAADILKIERAHLSILIKKYKIDVKMIKRESKL